MTGLVAPAFSSSMASVELKFAMWLLSFFLSLHLTCAPCFFPVSGGPDFNGVTEEYGCWRRGLLPAVRGAADVTRRDDGDVLTHFAF